MPANPPLHWTAAAGRLLYFEWSSARPRPVNGITLGNTKAVMHLNRLRVTILCTAVVQVVVGVVWFGLIAANPNPRRGTVVNLVALLVAAMLALLAQHNGMMKRTTVGLNWVLAVLWLWGLVAAVERVGANPDLAPSVVTMLVSTLAIIVPCAVNGIAVALLPRRVA